MWFLKVLIQFFQGALDLIAGIFKNFFKVEDSMDSVWHLNAPQWTDFESSPQPLDDDYFDREHKELEPQATGIKTPFKIPANPKCETNQSKPKIDLLEIPAGQDDPLINDIEKAKMTPLKVVSPKARSNKNQSVKETTFDNVLSEAMASLQLSIKKKTRRSHSMRKLPSNLTATPTTSERPKFSKSLNLGQATRSTPSNPIPMWIRKTKALENLNDIKKNDNQQKNEQEVQGTSTLDDLIVQDDQNKEDVDVKAEVITVESIEPVDSHMEPKVEDLVTEEQQKDAENLNEVNEAVEDFEVNDMPMREQPLPALGKRFSNISKRTSQSIKSQQQARFSTCQIRRRSLTQYRRRSNKYVSLAEAISEFQTRTPKRFRSISSKTTKPGPLQKVQQSSVSATIPISPALRCKLRKRATAVLSQEEREQKEIQEIRKHSVRGNMARTNSQRSLASNSSSKTTGKKPVALSDLTNPTDKRTASTSSEKNINHETNMKITVPSVISTNEGLAVENAEITNFGVPDLSIVKQNRTKIMPFSFEIRNKEMQKKKEKKIQELMTEEQNKTKPTFHARPVPAFKKPVLTVAKEVNAVKPKTKPCPFSFEERDKNLIKKKENFIKTVLEEDKKARVFQAKPIPEFKPVLVRGVSKENLNHGNKVPNNPPIQKSRISMLPVSKTGSRNCLLAKGNPGNQENQNPSINSNVQTLQQPKYKSHEEKNEQQVKPTKVLIDREFHLNTDKRAKERKDFDERIKQKEQEIEMLKKEEEAQKLKRAESERAEMRRMAETKARPMPSYKPSVVIRSTKPLTEPQSPGWAGKPKR